MTSDVQPGAPHVDTTGLSITDDMTVAGTGNGPISGRAASAAGAGAVLVQRSTAVRRARQAGLLYLVIAVFGAFAQVVRVKVYAPGDAATTAANLASNATLVRLSFVADLL